MNLVSLGKVVVTTSGTPVPLTAVRNTNANAVYFQFAFTGNTGPNLYIGELGLVIATLAHCFRVLVKVAAATAPYDQWSPQSSVSQAPFDLSAIYLDADHSGDFCLVSYLVA